MPATSFALVLDRQEYSRHEPSRSVVKVRVLPTPATGLDETVTVRLLRKSGVEAGRQEVVLSGDYPKGVVVAFDLTTLKDAAGIPLALRGEYLVEVKNTAGDVAATSSLFPISLITVEEMRKGYCFGLPLHSQEGLAPRRQPGLVTGVTVEKCSSKMRQGVFNLVYDATGPTLAWDGGPAVTLGTGVTQEILPGARGGYLEVTVDSFELPAADVAEALVIDKATMSDDFLRGEISRTVAEYENVVLQCFLEAQRVATEPFLSSPPAGEHYDREVPTYAYYRDAFNKNALAWHLPLPVGQLHRIDHLEGFLGNTKALTIARGGFAVNTTSGTVDVVPFSGELQTLWTFLVQINFWGIREVIVDFWRYAGVAGIEPVEGDLLRAIGYSAACSILTTAGQAYRGGAQSESISKDGVSRSASYPQQGGVYGSTITTYQTYLKEALPRLKQRYRGLRMVML